MARAEPKVAVVIAARVNIEASTAFDLSDELGAALRKRLVVSVISGQQAAQRIGTESGEVSPQCVADNTCLSDLSSRLGARELLLLSVTRVGDSLRIDVARFRRGDEVARSLAPIQTDVADKAAAFVKAAPLLVPSAPMRTVESESPRRELLTWTLAGTSALTLAASAGFGIATWLEHGDLDDRCSQQVCPEGDFDSLESRRLTADILLGVGIATGAAAAILWLTSDSGEDGTTITAGPGDVGIGVTTRF